MAKIRFEKKAIGEIEGVSVFTIEFASHDSETDAWELRERIGEVPHECDLVIVDCGKATHGDTSYLISALVDTYQVLTKRAVLMRVCNITRRGLSDALHFQRLESVLRVS